MITHIKGRLSEKSPTNVVIETNGIGYWINISLTTFSQIPDGEKECTKTFLDGFNLNQL